MERAKTLGRAIAGLADGDEWLAAKLVGLTVIEMDEGPDGPIIYVPKTRQKHAILILSAQHPADVKRLSIVYAVGHTRLNHYDRDLLVEAAPALSPCPHARDDMAFVDGWDEEAPERHEMRRIRDRLIAETARPERRSLVS